MNISPNQATFVPGADSGLRALTGIAAFYRIPVDPEQMAKDLALGAGFATEEDIVRGAMRLRLRARVLRGIKPERLLTIPAPAILKLRTGSFVVFGGVNGEGACRTIDPVSRTERVLDIAALYAEIDPMVVLVGRRLTGAGINPKTFGFRWFLPSVWRYRRPLAHVLVASLFIQVFALVTPLFFQVIVDKVLAHGSDSTLMVLIAGIVVIGLFDVILQFLRTYALSHTTNRIDVELGQRLFFHLLRLPLGYFESRPSGQTVARVRELESVRQFLTGQALFSALDLLFAFVFIIVLWSYSWKLTLVVLLSLPAYFLVAVVFRPFLQEITKEKFNRGAESQQFLVETVVGMHTVKASAVEPLMQVQWEEKLAAYVKSGFKATIVAAGGQNIIQYINRFTTAAILLLGAKAVMDGSLTVGELVAFNMIAGQISQPILRLSQVWQDFQQVQISVERIGDILNFPAEPRPATRSLPPPPRGLIEFKDIVFRYEPGGQEILKNISLTIKPGEVIGLVGPSGSGKSTIAKLIQRLYLPEQGQIFIDGTDISLTDPGWLRHHIGVVLQENLLFNRSVHDNIAFSNPALSRAQVMAIAKLAGADEFIAKLKGGYDSMIEERGANLSGGQRQRIAIARALALNPPILIFDEATSALDYESERVIQTNMAQIVKNRTVIIIAHRLAAVRPCNRIYGVADGRLVESGSHEELVAKPNGLYAKLWGLQSSHAL